jgi:hypothetical protein
MGLELICLFCSPVVRASRCFARSTLCTLIWRKFGIYCNKGHTCVLYVRALSCSPYKFVLLCCFLSSFHIWLKISVVILQFLVFRVENHVCITCVRPSIHSEVGYENYSKMHVRIIELVFHTVANLPYWAVWFSDIVHWRIPTLRVWYLGQSMTPF